MMNTDILRDLSYGVYVVSSVDGGRAVGCVANSVMQVTSSPVTVCASINHGNYTNECIKKSGKFAVSVLDEGASPALIGTFGFKSSRECDKFDGIEYMTASGVPVITNVCGWMVFDVCGSYEAETHTVFFGSLVDAGEASGKKPMTYSYYHTVVKGKSPKNAPTYVEESAEAAPAEKKAVYRCSICGYEYDGEIPFEELPDDWKCPVCGMGKDVFEKV